MIHWLQSVVAVVFTFGLVIFLHEFGHFLMCIKLGVRVERFAFGFGPELIGATHNGTRYSICLFPLGGFVKPAGDNLMDCTGEPNEYFSRPWHQRLGIVAAGPFMNYLLAFLLFFLVVWVRGLPEPSKEAVIGDLEMGYPAAQAGMRIDDRVTLINGTPIQTWAQMADFIHASPGKPLEIIFQHAAEPPAHATITPRLDSASGNGVIGIRPKTIYESVGMLGSAREGLNQCWLWTAYTVTTLVEKVHKREHLDVAGPVGIVQMVSQAAHTGLDDLIFLTGLISVAIGFFNLLPIPLLDGGHAAFYLWEGISRRKPTLRAMTIANAVGGFLLFSLISYATYNDIKRTRESHREHAAAQAQAPSSERSSPISPIK